eukprot:5772446-Alexandrium_andersonii.AAC.1
MPALHPRWPQCHEQTHAARHSVGNHALAASGDEHRAVHSLTCWEWVDMPVRPIPDLERHDQLQVSP